LSRETDARAFLYVLAGAVAIAGKAITTVRGLSALIGTLTVPAFYFLALGRSPGRLDDHHDPPVVSALLFASDSRRSPALPRGPRGRLPLESHQSRKRLFYLLFGAVVGIGLQIYYSFNLFPLSSPSLPDVRRGKGWKSFGAEFVPILRGSSGPRW
jgi:hypothetical protein